MNIHDMCFYEDVMIYMLGPFWPSISTCMFLFEATLPCSKHFVIRVGLFRGVDSIFKCHSFKALQGIHFVIRVGLFRGVDSIFKCHSFKALQGLAFASILGTKHHLTNYVYVNQSESTNKCASKLKILPTILNGNVCKTKGVNTSPTNQMLTLVATPKAASKKGESSI